MAVRLVFWLIWLVGAAMLASATVAVHAPHSYWREILAILFGTFLALLVLYDSLRERQS
jgi:hypothetical protein